MTAKGVIRKSLPSSPIVIRGEPVPKGRPRFTRSGRVYTPRETRLFEEMVAWETRMQMPLIGPLRLTVNFYYKSKRHVDVDNRIKALLDGLQMGGMLSDDRQVMQVFACQMPVEEDPRVEFSLQQVPSYKPLPFDDTGLQQQ